MTRIDLRPWAALAFSLAVLGYVGCTSSSPSSPAPGKPDTAGPGASSTGKAKGGPADTSGSDSKLLANLGNPAAVLVVSGEMDGYLEPCGCTEGQVGGLIRRYDFLERLHKQGVVTAQIDLGSLTKDPGGARGGFEQAKIKFDYSVMALKLLDYSAIALSGEDLRMGVTEALARFLNSLGDKTKLVAANVAAPAGYESIFRPSLIVSAGPVKLGITAVIDPEAIQSLNDPDKNLFTDGMKRPSEVLPGVLAELEGKTDYQVLMVQGPPKLARTLAESYPGFDIVVARSEFDDALKPDAEPLNGGKTQFVQVGRKGKAVGAFGLYTGHSERPRFYLVHLNQRYDGPAKPMKALIEADYRDTLRAAQVVETITRRDYLDSSGVSGATFVGADNCKSCHPNTYNKWATTKHFLGYDKLLTDPKPNVIYDAECVTCHTTGFELNSGWVSAEKTPYLKGNQCENCHGPGSQHVAQPDNVAYRKAMALTPEQAEKNRLCLKCHDLDNSPHFDMGKYYGQIAHKGLDDYKDPKVHRGFTPRLARSNPQAGAGKGDPAR